MTLRERWAGWTKEPFTSESRSHVSVWETPAPPTFLDSLDGWIRDTC